MDILSPLAGLIMLGGSLGGTITSIFQFNYGQATNIAQNTIAATQTINQGLYNQANVTYSGLSGSGLTGTMIGQYNEGVALNSAINSTAATQGINQTLSNSANVGVYGN